MMPLINRELDLRGFSEPVPVMETQRTIEHLQHGDIRCRLLENTGCVAGRVQKHRLRERRRVHVRDLDVDPDLVSPCRVRVVHDAGAGKLAVRYDNRVTIAVPNPGGPPVDIEHLALDVV